MLFLHVEAPPGLSSLAGSAQPTPLFAPTLNLVSHVLENFQGELDFLSGGLSPPQSTPGAATTYMFLEWKRPIFTAYILLG